MINTERLRAEDFAPRKNLVYVDVFELHHLYEKIAFAGSHILVGPKGIAKSLSVAAYAAKIDCPIITFDCSEDVRRSNLLGMFIFRGEETPFILGPIPSAFEVANEVGKCILVLEEINALSPTMQKILNSATDFRGRIELPEAKRVFELKKGAKLWVVGTMNPSVYGGVYALNEDLKSRFRMIRVEYPNEKEELQILKWILAEKKAEMPEKMLKSLIRLAFETRQSAFEYALSTRDVAQIAEDILVLGLQDSLMMASGKFEGDDVLTFQKRAESIFEDVDLVNGSRRRNDA